jgi:hypothetical protein
VCTRGSHRALACGPSTSPLDRMKTLRLFAAAILLAVVSAAGAEDYGHLTSTDIAVLRMALLDFAKRPDSVQYNRNNPHTYVLIGRQTDPATDRSYDGMYGAFIAEEIPATPHSAVAALLAQNRRRYLVTGLDVPASMLRVATSDQERFDPVEAPNSEVRTYVSLKAPGYSADGKYAFVWFKFRWSIHGAYAMYLMTRSKDQWVISAHAFRYLT